MRIYITRKCLNIYVVYKSTGDFWELKERIKRKDAVVKMQRNRNENNFDRRLNPISRSFVISDRPRIDTPCMNRIMNKACNIPSDSIIERIIAGKVPGGRITNTGYSLAWKKLFVHQLFTITIRIYCRF